MATYIKPDAIKDGTISASKTDETIATKSYVDTQIKVTNDKVGDLSQLQTTEKSNLVGAINELAQGMGGYDFETDLPYEDACPIVMGKLRVKDNLLTISGYFHCDADAVAAYYRFPHITIPPNIYNRLPKRGGGETGTISIWEACVAPFNYSITTNIAVLSGKKISGNVFTIGIEIALSQIKNGYDWGELNHIVALY